MRPTTLHAACLAIALACSMPARADWQKIQESGHLKVAVYNDFLPFSDKGAGIDVDLAAALSAKLGLTLELLPFLAGENMDDDLRNMVWKGHYLGYGPADVMLHVPVDNTMSRSSGCRAPAGRSAWRCARTTSRSPGSFRRRSTRWRPTAS